MQTSHIDYFIHRTKNQTMGNNEFLYATTINGRHRQPCLCENCRQQNVDQVLSNNSTNRQLEEEFLNNAEEYRRLNSLFEETMKKIVRGEAYRQQCLNGSPYTSFGWWMRSQPRYMVLSNGERRKFRTKVNMVHEVFINWDKIVKNLNDEEISYIDARKLSIQQLYQSIEPTWCSDYDEILRGPGDLPEELLYEENLYHRILEFITDTGILGDINHDKKECSKLGRRLQRDLNKICKYMRANDQR